MSPESTGRKFNLRIAIGIVVLVVAVIVIAQNTEDATLNFLSWDISMPLWLVLTIMFVLGMFLGGAVRGGIRKLRGVDSKKD
ncbi:MAG: LapA family protein [Actinomycetota bacterium]|nr:LapA family protein [Actinomycetota bacterium]MDP2288750.1 LapA family protein [Actinomycetota bacterium]